MSDKRIYGTIVHLDNRGYKRKAIFFPDGISYEDLKDKPEINGVELDKDSTSSSLGLQDQLTFDQTPQQDSTNPVQSGGVYDAVLQKADKTPLYTTLPQDGMLPNAMYQLGELSSDTVFTLAPATDNTIVNIWWWSFSTGSTVPNITWPANLTWKGGQATTVDANSYYEISVNNGYVLYEKF